VAGWRAGIGAVAAVVLAAGVFLLLGSRNAPSSTVTASPTPSEAAAQASAPTPPPPTPEGTPAPPPSNPVETGAPAQFTPPATPAQATATPTVEPGLWRVQGYVFDESGKPLKDVCVAGPRGCLPYTPHTDERGHWFIDVAQPINGITTNFDFYFQMPGRETVWWHFTPTGPIDFNVVLKPA
jgi:hypothetical protein